MTVRDALWSIVYCSHMAETLSDEQLYELTRKSDAHNHRLNISGILLARNNTFFQILEGQKKYVRSLYEKIAQDSRHSSVIKVLDGPIAQPAFSGWSMRLITTDDVCTEDRKIVTEALDAVEGRQDDEDRRLDLAALEACSTALAHGVFRRPPGRSAPDEMALPRHHATKG